MLGGEIQRSSTNHFAGDSANAQCNGKPAYSEVDSESLQKTIGERTTCRAEEPSTPFIVYIEGV